jgi:hypothetical protein
VAVSRVFTVEEANAEVPRLTALIERLQRGALALEHERATWTTANGASEVAPEVLLRERPLARQAADELNAVMTELERLGVELKDLDLGLVDFPTEVQGKDAFLCWQYGEPEVAFWHGLDEGFAGRRPLAGARARPPIQ